MGDLDRLLRALMEEPEPFVRAFLGEISHLVSRGGRLVADREADLVFEGSAGNDERVIVHLELQSRPDPNMGRRVFEYATLLHLKYRLAVHSVVLYASGRRQPTEYRFGHGAFEMRYRYAVVHLEDIDVARLLTHPRLAALVPLVPHATDGEIRAAVAMVRRTADSDRDPMTLISVMHALHPLALGVAAPEEEDEVPVQDMNAWLEKYASLDYDHGFAAGQQKGKLEGERTGKLDSITRLLALGGVHVDPSALRDWASDQDLDALLLVAARDPAAWAGPRSG